jgi:CTP synthase (UTP-ammonia lyase)
VGSRITIGLVGDHDETVPAHRGIPLALQQAGKLCAAAVEYHWIPTEEIVAAERVSAFDGLWCVPGSPYRSMEGALTAIRYARQGRVALLGTCGGFQHVVLEYARNVLGWADAEHAETAPDAPRAVISLLQCALVGTTGEIKLFPGTRIAAAYGADMATEEYQCRFGLNPRFQAELVAGPLRATAADSAGDVRAIELDGHPFFVATLFQPERSALRGAATPLVAAFVKACGANAGAGEVRSVAWDLVR